MTKLVEEDVTRIFHACNVPKGTGGAQEVIDITTVYLSESGLRKHEAEIAALLEELPITFKEGMSFLQACVDKDGKQWTGLHQTMLQLFLLGIAIGKVTNLNASIGIPSSALPGGMPYYQVH